MNSSELLRILNQAGKDELTALPGVGPVLVDRIIGARPFDSLEAALAVKGLGKNLVDKILASATVQPGSKAPESQTVNEAPPLSQVEDIKEALTERGKAAQKVIGESLSEISERLQEGVSELGETISKGSQAAYKAVEGLPEKFEQASRSRGPLWTILVSSAFTALIAIVLGLIILGAINGSLKFATSTQYQTMRREISELTTQVNDFRKDLDGLRTRVNTLEGLGERTVALEKSQQQLSLDMEKAGKQVTDMQNTVSALNDKVTQQDERTRRFDTFLKDLQAMLGKLFSSQGVTE
jgi:chromosome segregation ATPase